MGNQGDEASLLDDLSIGPVAGTSLATAAAAASDIDAQHQLVSTVRLYCIQTKQLQEMQIFLSGEQSENFYNSGGASPPPPPSAIPAVLNTSQPSSLLSTSLTVTPGGANTGGLNASSSSSILQQLLGNSTLSSRVAASASPVLGMIPQRSTQKSAINLGYFITFFVFVKTYKTQQNKNKKK